MLETSKSQGVEALELDLRTSFMKKMMANQERTIIEQTIRFDFAFLNFQRGSVTHQRK
jgi:hypothetical protein